MSDHVAIAFGDDWQGLYINGELITEGHTLDPALILEIVTGVRPDQFEVDSDWLEEEGRFPSLISAVKRA